MSVIQLSKVVERRQAVVWQRYLDARQAAEEHGRIEDGIAAGLAWYAWLTLFQSPAQTAKLAEFPKRQPAERSNAL